MWMVLLPETYLGTCAAVLLAAQSLVSLYFRPGPLPGLTLPQSIGQSVLFSCGFGYA